MVFNRGTLVSATSIYLKKCPFTVLSAPFLFFPTLPYDSDYSPKRINRHLFWALSNKLSFTLFILFFFVLITPCLEVAVKPFIEWNVIKKRKTKLNTGANLGRCRTSKMEVASKISMMEVTSKIVNGFWL